MKYKALKFHPFVAGFGPLFGGTRAIQAIQAYYEPIEVFINEKFIICVEEHEKGWLVTLVSGTNYILTEQPKLGEI